ncbi:hypothetical protein EMIHUDRAFT_224522 [Emiliania huxleyi CCMP1516]|uniref:Protein DETOXIFICATION n=2 Tax=Emiliania huxleyi TaxID=2903 RepID=A0A0D3KRR5_EMIH1|nr:hypothetical protein EMIHUDRAFT_224522 [Emiliania huxleyi CCMP1516]EOD38450.1 hypothetical protein EMIHUDRAFT_224522 [Emiliania huxleyi CCMP1516]|eukprot:XP_005790879.1 hypothetical protein EMIHUDRAFT_224522 [Emiliania huxleyi CCMP1516]
MYNLVPARLVLLLAGGSLGLSSSRLTAASSAPLLCGLQCWQRTPPALGRPPVLALEATARAGGGCCAFRRWQGPPPERPPRAGGVRCCATAPSLTEEAPEEASLAARAAARAAENAEILAIAVPALLNTLMDPFLGVVDTLFVGRTCSSVALGAVAASSEIFTLCIAASLALRESASSTLVRLFAQGRRPAAVAFARRTLQLAVLVGAFLTLLLAGPAAPWCVGLMGAPVGSPLHPDALAYARMRALALPAALALSASEGIFRGMGDTSAPLRAGLVASLANLLLDPGLMIWPARLGVTGAATATGASQAWLLLVLAAEAPAVAGQVLCSRRISRGDLHGARALLLRLLRRAGVLGGATALLLLSLAGPASSFLIPSDPATRESARRLFGWAALCTPLVAPNALCEAVLLGAGLSYKYLALATLSTAIAIGWLTGIALSLRPDVSSVWICILLFFLVRLATSAGRIFSGRGGFGEWEWRAHGDVRA